MVSNCSRIPKNLTLTLENRYDDGLYSVNGALSDWMYHEHQIMAMSPEMGPSFTTHLSDEEAFWPDRDLILPMALEVQKLILEATWRAGAL